MSRFLIMAGGTGGHVFPALAVAEELRAGGDQVVWLGTRRGLEARTVPAAGFEMEWIEVRGLQRGLAGWLLLPWRLARSLAQVLGVVLRRRPDAVLGMGGYVAGPGGLVAWLLRRPLLIHEQNAVAGLTNRWLAHFAERVMTGYPAPARLPRNGSEYLGNPVRGEIAALPEPADHFRQRSGSLRLLVLGGSQGARVFNETLPRLLAEWPAEQRPEVLHQAGRGSAGAVTQAYRDGGLAGVRVAEFIDDMAQAYDWCDLVLCRAGAMTLAELCAAGRGAILVPFPHAANDHQAANAGFLERHGAARVLPQTQLERGDGLRDLLAECTRQPGGPGAMAEAARRLALPEAARQVARNCRESVGA
ncbi:MAG: undecaprenyldiphospho-muramoylpentapeptide beta-N-acetylglucosaminyltransferase [Gammaproteobacteria bacterium]|jgi:UDP-N-acetylglucosamine--N-acetylmuramyl-(pentapeptide) pyrophosphoryl-undecaprenol N-acetylglucosamine transferase|nr:undecaprenyldiphospho-muramoylpentapeptide beta-N-acetylglucosaminyltransferase [Gammaproteobacteria bacterium]